MSAGRIDLVVETSENIYILELKMSDNGGVFLPHIKSFLVIMLMPMPHLLNQLSHLRLSLIGRVGG